MMTEKERVAQREYWAEHSKKASSFFGGGGVFVHMCIYVCVCVHVSVCALICWFGLIDGRPGGVVVIGAAAYRKADGPPLPPPSIHSTPLG